MRVVHLIDHMGVGGAQKVLLDLVEARGPNVEPTVCSLRDHILPEARERLRAADVPYRSLGLTRRAPFGLTRIRGCLKAANTDVLHTHLEYSNTFGAAAALSLGPSRPLLVSQIDNDPRQQYTLLHRVAGRVMAPYTAAHVLHGQSVREATVTAFGDRAQHIAVIPPGLSADWFGASRIDAGRVAALRGGARRVIGTVARLAPQKAIDRLLAAMPRVLAAEPSTRLLIAGDGPLRASLERQCRELGITDTVSFLGFQHQVADIYAAMDAFVLPSRYEGFGVVLIEAMAMGVPVVATRVVGIEDVVTDGRTGMLVPFDDADALSSAVLRLFDDSALRSAFSRNGQAEVRRRYSREKMAAAVEALYADLAAKIARHRFPRTTADTARPSV